MQKNALIETLNYRQPIQIGDATMTLWPAGHLLGSAQVCVDIAGYKTVISGDYKTQADPTCHDFEPVQCHEFITESTFALPIYRWASGETVMEQINTWWRANRDQGLNSVIFVYALGKAQRVLSGLDASIGPILLHGAVDGMTKVYHNQGVDLPPAKYADPATCKENKGKALILAPPSANGSPWMRKLQPYSTAIASGWMAVRGRRRFRPVNRGFVLSDHADWKRLIQTIKATNADRIGCMHGYTEELATYLSNEGYASYTLETRFVSDEDQAA